MKLKRNMIPMMIFMVLIAGCGASQKTYEANSMLDELMTQKEFKIAIRSAQPMNTQAWNQIANSGLLQPGNNASRIDLSGEGYFIKIVGDSVSANIPYYGERQMGGGYNSNSGIQFNAIAEDLEIVKDEEKHGYQISFNVDSADVSETFFVNTTVGTGLGSIVYIRSSHRNRIQYAGTVTSIQDADDVSVME